jgi:hypothetical protein
MWIVRLCCVYVSLYTFHFTSGGLGAEAGVDGAVVLTC